MIFKRIQEDIDAVVERDPAARSRLEVAICYPGLHAIIIYRFAHGLWNRKFHLLARVISQIGRWFTGVEIHPGARIGRRFVIDHGHGVVIGETSEIDDDVTLYQGVTLGGISPSVDSHAQKNVKRHPTLMKGVIVGSGAQILGPIIVGEDARVGANAVVTRDVPGGVTAIGIPAHVVMPKDRNAAHQFWPYGTPVEGCPDPVLASIESLRGQVTTLLGRLEEVEGRLRDLQDAEPDKVGEEMVRHKDRPAPVAAGERGRN